MAYQSDFLTISEGGEKEGFPIFWAVFLNVCPGFGLGSFLQKNTLGAVIQLVLDAVPAGYGIYRSFEIVSDWHPALYIAFPFVAIYVMCVDVWPVVIGMTARVFGVTSALIYHQRLKRREAVENPLSLSLGTGRIGVSFKF